MKRLLLLLQLLLAGYCMAQSTVPTAMTYQGRLTDANGNPSPDGTGYEIEVRLWSTATGNSTLRWASRYTGVAVKGGAFSLILGGPSGVTIPGAANANLRNAWSAVPTFLAITVTKNATGAAIVSPTEILPRQEIFTTPYAFRTEKSDDSAHLNGQPASYFSPAGSVIAFAGTAAPDGWLLCDGSTQNVANYAALFAAIGNRFGGDGTSTFKVPDMRGRFPLGVNPAGNSLSERTLAQQGGEENHTLTIAEMPNHGHDEKFSTTQAGSTTGPFVGGATFASGAQRALRTDTADQQSSAPIVPQGGGAAHNTMPPFVGLNFIIKY